MPASSSGLSRDHLAAWASLATVLERLPTALDAQLRRDHDLSHYEHGLLYALDSSTERSLRMSTLAGYASSTLSRLSRAISRLETKGWVQRSPDPTDGRFTLAILTDEGHDLVVRSTPAHHALVEEPRLRPALRGTGAPARDHQRGGRDDHRPDCRLDAAGARLRKTSEHAGPRAARRP